MKKFFIPALALFLIFAALTGVYRYNNPPAPRESRAYISTKASYLTYNYANDAEVETGEDGNKPVKYVYAAAFEYPVSEGDIVARFAFFDINGGFAYVYSDNTGVARNDHTAPELSKEVIEYLNMALDDSYEKAENNDYGAPAENTMKIYLRLGDGVYLKTTDEVPEKISGFIKEAEKKAELN